MGLAHPCMRVDAVTPRLAEAPAREGLLWLQRSARRAAPRQLRSNKTFQTLAWLKGSTRTASRKAGQDGH